MAYVLIVKGYCHGSRKDRGNKYTASDGLGVFAESPEIGPSRNTLERGGNKGDRLKVAISQPFYCTYLKISRSVQFTLRRVSSRVLLASYRSSSRSIVAIDKITLFIHVLEVVNFTSSVSPRSVIL